MLDTILHQLARNQEDWVFHHLEETLLQENKAHEEHPLTAKDHQLEVKTI